MVQDIPRQIAPYTRSAAVVSQSNLVKQIKIKIIAILSRVQWKISYLTAMPIHFEYDGLFISLHLQLLNPTTTQ